MRHTAIVQHPGAASNGVKLKDKAAICKQITAFAGITWSPQLTAYRMRQRLFAKLCVIANKLLHRG